MRSHVRAVIGALLVIASSGCDLFDSGDRPDAGRPGSAGVGDACTDPVICRSGLICAAEGTCQPSGFGVEGAVCSLTGDCGPALYCDARRVCSPAGMGAEGADCEGTQDCEHGLTCNVEGFGGRCRASGSGDLGDACESGSDCLAGLSCLESAMGRRCDNPPVLDGDGGPPPVLPPLWPGVECTVDDGAPRAYFRVPRGTEADGDFYRLPFPNDVRRRDGGLDLSGAPTPGSATPVDVLGLHVDASQEDLDGFATNPVIYFRFSRAYDGASLGDRVRWVDITPGSPTYGQDRGLAWITTFGSITRYICPDWIAFRAGHGDPLRPGTTYALILERGVTASEGGGEFARDADLDALLSDAAPSDGALMHAWSAYAPLRAFAAAGEVDASTILNAAVFTTQTIEDVVPALRAAIRAREVPALSDVTVCGEGVTSPCDDGTEQRRCGAPDAAFTEVHARIALPIFQRGTAPYETPEDGGAIELDASGAATVVREEPVCMVMTIPTGAPPAGGFPVVIAAHGTGGSFTGPVGDGLAQTWATGDVVGAAMRAVTLSIDLPQHGSRRGFSTRTPDRLVFNFANPRAARDVWLQGAADLMSLVRFAEGYAADAASSPTGEALDLDGARIVVWAHSQGATHAALMTPFEPGVRAVLFSGLGGDLTESLLTKTEPVDIASVVPIALLDPDGSGALTVGDYHPALAMIQAYYERVDPVNYGRRMWRDPREGDLGRHLMMTWGAGDHFSTERTMNAFARSASLSMVAPQLADIGVATVDPPLSGNATVGGEVRTVGLRQYAPPDGVDGHFVSTRAVQGRADATRFVLESLAGGTPTIGE
ncbi:MAG: alpha/beta hydrolase [Myxococcota bacterium]|nr:alpha/beta hydrolase [Myxococcota bacterium]